MYLKTKKILIFCSNKLVVYDDILIRGTTDRVSG